MTLIAPHLTAYLKERLQNERRASAHTCDSYAYAFRLLFEFASKQIDVSPSQLHFEHLDAPFILSFLNNLESERKNSPSSRNIRLAAVKSFMRFMQYRAPSALEQIQRVLAIPAKKTDSKLVKHLSISEMQAILDAPCPTTWDGIRDRAMLHVCFAGGLRVSELISLGMTDLQLQPCATILVRGKGRKERCLPLWKETASTLRAWLSVRGEILIPELFSNVRGEPLTRSGFEYILRKHVRTAEMHCPSLKSKHVSPHVLRHTCALTILQSTKDLRKVSLWLGHASIQTTEIYTRADSTVKLETLESRLAPQLRTGKFKATDKLIALLKTSTVMRSKNKRR